MKSWLSLTLGTFLVLIAVFLGLPAILDRVIHRGVQMGGWVIALYAILLGMSRYSWVRFD